MRFRTTLLIAGKTATGIEVPPEVVEALGKSKRPPIRVTINGYTYRNTIAVMGGKYMVGVSAEHRAGAGVSGGDEIDVDIELDDEPRTVEIPPELAKALAKDKTAKATFDALSYSNQRRHVDGIAGAKTEETRQRRLKKTLAELHG
jgi:HEAT repeat protein